MSVPFISLNSLKTKFSTMIKDFEALKRTSESKQGPAYKAKVDALIKDLDDGIDIFGKDRIDQLNKDLDIEYGKEEQDLYKDNCKKNEDGICPRIRWCGGTDKAWVKKANERILRLERKNYLAQADMQRYQAAMEREMTDKSKLLESIDYSDDVDVKDDDKDEEHDRDFQPGTASFRRSSCTKNVEKSSIATRSSSEQSHQHTVGNEGRFPDIPVRTGYKTFNTDIIECLTVMQSVYKVDARKARELLAYIANKIFQQHWTVAAEKRKRTESEEEIEECKAKRRKLSNLDHQLPDRKAVASYLADFSLLSFTDMAERISNCGENETVTYGVDDTIKAAGFKRYDVKTNHVTIEDENKNRETFTSGFYQNASHKGKDAAETVQHDLAKMAVVTNTTYREILDHFQFFMTDRAGDSDVMLDELGIDETKRLKCNAYVLLVVDVALDKVFRDVETLIGVSNLIGKGAAHVFSSPKNSVWFLGLIAVAKLLSPSHNTESISLYEEYTKYLSGIDEDDLKNDFKGFISNRFGRLGELSAAITKHIHHIRNFFDNQVDENANKLVLAVHNFVSSDWFLTCCDVAKYFYDEITIPIKKLIGMDEFKKTKSDQRSWSGIREEFEMIITNLTEITNQANENDGMDCLKSKAAAGIKIALQRQLEAVSFFRDPEKSSNEIKAPLTNLGCEGNFSSLGNDCKRAGGSVKLQTISDKSVIAHNKLYAKQRWESLSNEERRKKNQVGEKQ